MYCPNCATPIDGVKYCRSCGANVSLIPQALSGQLVEGERRGGGKWSRPPSIEAATSSFFSGIGLFVAAFAVLSFAPAGRIWWFWLLIPAFGSIGHGVGQYLRYRDQQQRSQAVPLPGPVAGVPDTGRLAGALPPEAGLPGSVVESTTRHLDPVGGDASREKVGS